MAFRALEYLKNRFLTGAKPAQADYHDLMDSFVHKDEVASINATVIDERINNYDTDLRSVTVGELSSLGDVLLVLSGFTTADDIKALIDAASGEVTWSSIQGKPTSAYVSWDEQTISTDTYLPELPASPEAIKSTRVVRGIGAIPAAQKVVITDILVTAVQVRWEGMTQTFSVKSVRGVVIGVNPRISL